MSGVPQTSSASYGTVTSTLGSATWWTRLVPLATISIPTAVSLCLLILERRQYGDTGKLYKWSTSNRALVQVIVNVLSSLLGFLWTYSICTSLNLLLRHDLLKHRVDLNALRLYSALSHSRADLSLPWKMAAVTSFASVFLTYFPTFYWTGALTPSTTLDPMYGLSLSVPSSGPYGNYSHLHGDCWTAQQSNGTFTNCLQKFQSGNLLSSIAAASYPSDSPKLRKKWDNTGFEFIGRSYGVGSAVGLTDRHITGIKNVYRYGYYEVGFIIDTKCVYNRSAAMEIQLQQSNTEAFPNFYLAIGALPNADWTWIQEVSGQNLSGKDFYAQFAFSTPNSIVSTFHQVPIRDDDPRWMFGIVAGSDYVELNSTQCEITFRPSKFEVMVNTSLKTIKVTPLRPIESGLVDDPDPTYELRKRAIESYGLSFITTSLYTSTVGNAFLENVRSLQTNYSVERDAKDPNYQSLVLESIADSLTVIMEDSLVALGSAALSMANATRLATTNVVFDTIRIGGKPWTQGILVINLIGLLFVLCCFFRLVRADISAFDFCDLGCMVFGIFHGVVTLSNLGESNVGDTPWNGDPKDPRIRELKVSLLPETDEDE